MFRVSRLAWLLAVVGAGAILFSVPAYAAEGGTIQGKVVNGTANGGSVEGVEVTVTAYFGQTERNKYTATADKDGNFQVTGLDTGSNYSYEATSNYQKGDYSAPRVSFSNPGETRQVTLKVYDSTTDESAVKATAKHYVVTPGKDGNMEVQEILLLKNDTDRTYIGAKEIGPDQRETSRYMPPSGARNIQYGDTLMSCCVVKQGAGFVDTMAISPGEIQKVFAYQLPYSGTTLAFTSTLQQDVGSVQLLVPSGIRANISGLANHGTQNIQNTPYQVFSAENVPANTTLDVQLEGLPESTPASPIVMAGVAVGVLMALAAAFYVLRRRSHPAPVPAYSYAALERAPKRGQHRGSAAIPRDATVLADPTILELEKSDLLAAMANLDDWFEAGRISRKDYERLRSEKKQRLMALLAQNGRKGTPARV